MPVPPPVKTASSRYQFIDLLRGWAVFIMIETHVTNALLRIDLKAGGVFPVLTFLNGLVAPSFLFCAGFALAIRLGRRWQDFTRCRPPLWRYLARMLFIMAVGYSLHLPFFSLSRLRAFTDESAWQPFFQADILQTIAVTLLLLVLLAVCVRTQHLFAALTAMVAALIVAAAPVLREMDLTSLPVWLRPYFTTQFKSQFPLFPWSAFLMAGTLTGYFFVRAKERGRERAFVRGVLVAAFLALLAGIAAEALPIHVYTRHDFWKASPEFFLVRLGLVMSALAALWHYEAGKGPRQRPALMRLFGQESLLVYVLHLLIVYGQRYDFSFIRVFGPRLGFAECTGLFLGLSLVMYAVAWVWHWLKAWNGRLAALVQYATLAVIVAVFVLRES